jgi:hypothetical protein
MNQPFWRNIARCGVSALGILLWFNLLGAAQQTLGGIVGTVTDSSGAVVPAAKAELVSTTTGLNVR